MIVNGSNAVAGQTVSLATITSGQFRFTPTGTGNPDGSFTFQVQDTGGTANGGVDLEARGQCPHDVVQRPDAGRGS